jgi:hypothetical protein
MSPALRVADERGGPAAGRIAVVSYPSRSTASICRAIRASALVSWPLGRGARRV